MKKYSLVFAFDEKRNNVLLIKKKISPHSHIGKYNGLGGKVEEGETFEHCAAREFIEESDGLPCRDLRHVATVLSPSSHVEVYSATSDFAFNLSFENEEGVVESIPVHEVFSSRALNFVPNAKWLIALSLDDKNEKKVTINYEL